MADTLVTSYLNPDIDGTVSAIAYSELLKFKGRSAEAILFGKPQPSVNFLTEKLGYHLPFRDVDPKLSWKNYIVMDTSSTKRLPKFIDPDKVLEIIDHHPVEDGSEFPKAIIQNEEVGAVATLVFERALQAEYEFNEEMSRLIYLAIFDNTAFLLSNVTPRDQAVIDSLTNKFSYTDGLTRDFINFDQEYKTKHFEDAFVDDIKEIETKEGACLVGQIIYPFSNDELGVDKRVESLTRKLGQKRDGKIMMSIIDPISKTTHIYTKDENLKNAVNSAFKGKFAGHWVTLETPILRKKILKAILS